MLFDEGDASLLKKWIVKRLEDISDADSDVLADYVLALLRHEQGEDEVKRLCVEQLVDFLRDHAAQFVETLFAALHAKNFLSVNSTLGNALSVSIPPPTQESPRTSPTRSTNSFDADDQPRPHRGRKRPYIDPDAPRDDGPYMPATGARGNKAARRGGSTGPGRWTRGGADISGGRAGNNPYGLQQFGVPPMASAAAFPWVPPETDPMAAFLAAQAWSMFPVTPVLSGKAGEEGKVVKKVIQRCKDYDEKGFCMKGDMCPYEHGVDHIVVPGQDQTQDEYDPNDSIIIPTTSTSSEPSRRGGTRGRGSRGSRASTRARGGRSEFSHMGPSRDRTNTTLVVENIPQDKLTDAAIREFFAIFGNITSVEIHPLKHLAIVNFESWEMAKQAYESPAPIFDNRFVKVFWYKSDADILSTDHGSNARSHSAPGATERENTEEMMDVEEIKMIQEEKQRAYEEKMAKKKAHEAAKKKIEKMAQDLEKRKQEETRRLREKLAKKHGATAPPSPADSSTIGSKASASSPGSDKPKPDASTTAALKAQLELLQAEAEALGIDSNAEESFDLSSRGRGRGRPYRGARAGYTPRGRGYNPYYSPRGGYAAARGRGGAPSMKLDNRPKRVAVTATDLRGQKDEDFRHYLINTGLEFEAIEAHPEQEDTQVVTFKDRLNAEKFVFSGANLPNIGHVVMKWYTPAAQSSPTKAFGDDGDTPMNEVKEEPRVDEDSYDLADADESRWLPE